MTQMSSRCYVVIHYRTLCTRVFWFDYFCAPTATALTNAKQKANEHPHAPNISTMLIKVCHIRMTSAKYTFHIQDLYLGWK